MNMKRRPREYLTVKEVELLTDTARKRGRYGHRDATMILIAFRHGLRPSEVCALRWEMVDLGGGLLHVRRSKNGTPSVQPLGGVDLRALRKLKTRGNRESLCIHDRTRCADLDGGISEDDCANGGEWGFSVPSASAHAAACVRVQARQ
jgi:integrase